MQIQQKNQLDITPDLSSLTPLFNAKQDVLTAGNNITITGNVISADSINGVSQSTPTYISGPANWISATYAYNWVDQATGYYNGNVYVHPHSVLTSQGTSSDVYQSMTFTIGKTYTLKADVKLVGLSSAGWLIDDIRGTWVDQS